MNRILLLISAIAVVLALIFFLRDDGITNSDKSLKNKEAAKTNQTQKKEVDDSNVKQEEVQPKEESNQANQNNNQKNMQLEIKTTKEGSGERVVKSGDTISVYYIGKLTDGTVFDSNAGSGKTFDFTVGAGMVIEGWEKGFVGAKVGEKRTLTIPSEMGYGARGAGDVIPPNATLVFDVELVSIK